MERRVEREFEILTAIDEGQPLTQRALAQRLGVALGLANLYVKRLAKKGYIKTATFSQKPAARKRLRYLLTAKGIAEKSRLTYEHMAWSLALYRRTRQTLRESLAELPAAGLERIAFYGIGEPAELAYLTVKELGVEPSAIYADAGDRFLGRPVRPIAELRSEDFDALVVATFDRPEPHVERLLALGVPRTKLLPLRRPASGWAPVNGTVRGRAL